MITEFGEFGFDMEGKELLSPVYNFTKEPSNSYSFIIKIKGKWKNIYYWNSPENPKWLWAPKHSRIDKQGQYEVFPYRVTKFYYNTTMEVSE